MHGIDFLHIFVFLSIRIIHVSCLLLTNELVGIMSSASKHQKLRTPLFVQDEDRLTNLPSCLKTKILSCLPMKDAVKTSVLSKEWKQSWTEVTNLNFDDNPRNPTQLKAKSFESFVNRVLLLHDRSCLQSFRLKSYGTYDGSVVNAWIASVLLCKVQEFDLHVDLKRPVFFPPGLFLCKTLVVLKLNGRRKVTVPTSICLPVLKTLHFVEVELPDDVSIVNLVSGCPVLKVLSLHRCIGKYVGVINITTPVLTSLIIISSPYEYKGPDSVFYDQIVIDAPALQDLYISDKEAQSYVMKNLNSLIEAVLEFGDLDDDLLPIEHPKVLTDLFNGISRVQNLVLSHNIVEAIVLEELVLPTFCNLTCLKLSTCDEWTYLPKLLESFPCLETLHIEELEYGTTVPRSIHEVTPSCLLMHLKIINIDKFRGLEYEMEMVEYFLKNARVLEKMTIFYERFAVDKVADAEFFQQLQMFLRSSTSCKVEVSWDTCAESAESDD